MLKYRQDVGGNSDCIPWAPYDEKSNGLRLKDGLTLLTKITSLRFSGPCWWIFPSSGDMTVCRLINMDRNFGEVFCPHCLQSGGRGECVTRSKEDEAWSWSLSSFYCWSEEWVEPYL